MEVVFVGIIPSPSIIVADFLTPTLKLDLRRVLAFYHEALPMFEYRFVFCDLHILHENAVANGPAKTSE